MSVGRLTWRVASTRALTAGHTKGHRVVKMLPEQCFGQHGCCVHPRCCVESICGLRLTINNYRLRQFSSFSMRIEGSICISRRLSW